MASINKVIVLGNLGRDPETRYTAGGDCICHLNLATSDKWTDKESGDKRENTEWHRIVLYRKLGETAALYLKKGSAVYIEGKLHTRKWTDKNGNDRYTTEIVGEHMQMLGGHQYDFLQDDRGPQKIDAAPGTIRSSTAARVHEARPRLGPSSPSCPSRSRRRL